MKKILLTLMCLGLVSAASATPRFIQIEGAELQQADGIYTHRFGLPEHVYENLHHCQALLTEDGWLYIFDREGEAVGIVGPYWTDVPGPLLTVNFAP